MGGGFGGRRKVWEGSQKSAGCEKTVGGLMVWLLKAVETGGLLPNGYPIGYRLLQLHLLFSDAWQIA